MSGTLGRSGVRAMPGANDIMNEMARKLKARKAKVEGVPEVRSHHIISSKYMHMKSGVLSHP